MLHKIKDIKICVSFCAQYNNSNDDDNDDDNNDDDDDDNDSNNSNIYDVERNCSRFVKPADCAAN